MSGTVVRNSVDALAKLSKQLNRITDEANETVRRVEQFLEDCSLGLVVSVHCEDLDEGDEDGLTCSTFLEYRRYPIVGGKFRIVVNMKDPDSTNIGFRPWSDSDRDTKLGTFAYLPELLMKLVSDAQAKVNENEVKTRSIIETVQDIISPKAKK